MNMAIIAFGRMNPPTIGHLKLMQTMVVLGNQYNAVPMLFLSHSVDKKKNPLSYEVKIGIVTRFVPKGLRVMHSEARNIFDVLKLVSKLGFNHVIMIAGSDRQKDFERFGKYADELGLASYEVVSSGERDADSDDVVSGISATKLREYAEMGCVDEFVKCCAVENNIKLAKELYTKTREGMGLK